MDVPTPVPFSTLQGDKISGKDLYFSYRFFIDFLKRSWLKKAEQQERKVLL